MLNNKTNAGYECVIYQQRHQTGTPEKQAKNANKKQTERILQ